MGSTQAAEDLARSDFGLRRSGICYLAAAQRAEDSRRRILAFFARHLRGAAE